MQRFMQDKWGWELPQLSIDTCSGWQQQIEDWRCLCVWWKTNLKTYVFWESFEITVTINNFLSCSLMNWTESSIYSLPGKGMLAFSLSVFWNIFNNLTHSFFYLHVAFSKTFENDSVWQPQGCWWLIEILWWPEVMSAFLRLPFPWHQNWIYRWRKALKIWHTNWIHFEWKELFRLLLTCQASLKISYFSSLDKTPI